MPYEQFQTVPSSIPPTPSPEWPTELSPLTNNAHSSSSILVTPPHSNHMSGHHVHVNYVSPLQLREPTNHVSMGTALSAASQPTNNIFHQTSIDGKPVIQAAVLAGI